MVTKFLTGVENVSDHGTIGPRKLFGITENIQDSVAEEENARHEHKAALNSRHTMLK